MRQHRSTEEAQLGPSRSKRLEAARRALHMRLTEEAQRYFQRKAAADRDYEKARRELYAEFHEIEAELRRQAQADAA